MAPEDWAITQSTTNLGESQHHWTNQHTGIKHSLVEAIVTLVHLFYSSVQRFFLVLIFVFLVLENWTIRLLPKFKHPARLEC
jgi:hypothetical protein